MTAVAEQLEQKIESIWGLDLGQASDYSALVGIERVSYAEKPAGTVAMEWADLEHLAEQLLTEKKKPKIPHTRYNGRAIIRFDVNTPYPDIVQKICRIFDKKEFQGSALVIDGTGVGRPVVDGFRKARPNCRIIPVTITAGATAAKCDGTGYWHVPKKELVSVTNMLMQTKRFEVSPDLADAPALLRELRAFRYKQNLDTGNVSMEAWREKDKDDIVLATALALWWGERARQQLWVK